MERRNTLIQPILLPEGIVSKCTSDNQSIRIGGTVAAVITCPLEVVKTRSQVILHNTSFCVSSANLMTI
jgi:hypothetical protein